MKSDRDRAASFIDSLDKNRRVIVFARLVYELTLAGRTCYSNDSKGLDYPILLREINELQHRLSAQIMKVMSDDIHLLSSSEVVALFLEREYHDELISREIRRSFIDAITAFVNQ